MISNGQETKNNLSSVVIMYKIISSLFFLFYYCKQLLQIYFLSCRLLQTLLRRTTAHTTQLHHISTTFLPEANLRSGIALYRL